jgi:hypothetical protein
MNRGFACSARTITWTENRFEVKNSFPYFLFTERTRIIDLWLPIIQIHLGKTNDPVVHARNEIPTIYLCYFSTYNRPISASTTVTYKWQNIAKWRMAPSGMLRRVVLVRTDVSEERSASIIRVTRIGWLGTTLAITSNRRTLRRNAKWEGKLESNSELYITIGDHLCGLVVRVPGC